MNASAGGEQRFVGCDPQGLVLGQEAEAVVARVLRS